MSESLEPALGGKVIADTGLGGLMANDREGRRA